MILLLVFVGPKFEPRDQWKEHFTNKPVFQRFFDVLVAAWVIKAKYFTGWLFANANCIVCGFSFNGVDPKTDKIRWDRACSVKVGGFELSDNPKEKFESWNISVQVWIRRYIFERIMNPNEIKTNPKKAALAANVSFMISAFWHGFYPYYYFNFLLFFMIQQIAKTLYYAGDFFKFIPQPIQFAIRWVMMYLVVNTMLVAFALLEFQKVAPYAESILYFPYVTVIPAYALCLAFGPTKKKVKAQ